MAERQWFHEAHGLHDDAHHQAHRPLDLCVPLMFRSDYIALEAENQELRSALSAVQHAPTRRDQDRLIDQILGAQP